MRVSRFRVPCVLLAMAMLASTTDVAASSGALDASYDHDGVLLLRYGGILDKVAGIARLADGRIVLAGAERGGGSGNTFYGIASGSENDIGVARYAADGSVDTSFGFLGFAQIDGGGTGAIALALETSGELLVGNTASVGSTRRLRVQRLRADGFPLPGAVYEHPALGDDELTALVVQTDDKIVIAGNVTSGGVRRIVVVRLNANLTLDAGGIVAALPGDEIEGHALAVQGDGKILVGGRHASGAQESALVIRLAADLASTDATATFLASTMGRPNVRALLVEPDGKILAAGSAAGESSDDAMIARLGTDLSLLGSHLVDASAAPDFFRSLARQPDGRIVAVGTRGSAGHDVLCTRFNANLTVDEGFSASDLPGGKGIQDGVNALVQPDGTVLVTANAAAKIDEEGEPVFYDFLGDNVALFRLEASGTLDDGFTHVVPSYDRTTIGEYPFAVAAVVAEPGGGVTVTALPYPYLVAVYAPPTDFIVARLDADGVPDAAFGTNGFATADFGALERPSSLLRQADGKYVVAGTSSTIDDSGFITVSVEHWAIARFASDGTLDPTFGSGGKLTHGFSGGERGTPGRMLQQSDGKLIVGGAKLPSYTGILVRYTATGTLDPTWGTGGVKTAICPGLIAMQADDKLVAVCETTVIRYGTTGNADPSFTTYVSPTPLHARDIFVQPDGKILVVGGEDGKVRMLRLESTGLPDTGFGSSGVVETDVADLYKVAFVRQNDGKILIPGWSTVLTPSIMPTMVARIGTDGALDASFGTGGILTVTDLDFFGRAATLTSDGALIVVGEDFGRFDEGAGRILRFLVGSCGNGTTEPGESCDDGNPADGDGCDANCTPTGCGNGIVTAGETCDDGNASAGDCCDAVCQLESDGSACDAGDACTTGATCTAGACGGGGAVVCGGCERCDADRGCIADLRPSCFSTALPGASAVQLKNSPLDAKDQLQFQIKKGDFTLLTDYGDPVLNGGDDYRLCLFDVSGLDPKVVIASNVPAGGTCQGKPCWIANDGGFKYKEKTGVNGGINQITLKSSEDASSQNVKGKGAGLALPKLSLRTPLRMQLQASNGKCWEDAYVTASKNTYQQYKAKGEF